MAHSLTVGMQAVTQAQAIMPAMFVEIDTASGNLYAWSGFGTITWNGHDWIGSGQLLKISDISEVTTVAAAGVTFTLSGIPSALISLILQSVGRYQPCKLWVGALDETFAVIADPYLIFSGLTDTASLAQQENTCTATVTGEGKLIRLRIPLVRRHTNQDQKIERPYDNGYRFVDFLQDAALHFSRN